MPIQLQEKKRGFERLRHTAREKIQLAEKGLQHVLSSNVSAIGRSKDALIIRFHGGATYEYPGKQDLYRKMLQSNSKGKFVWSKLIRPGAAFSRIAGVSLKSDAEFTDKDLMEAPAKIKKRSKAAETLAQLGILASKTDLIAKGIFVPLFEL